MVLRTQATIILEMPMGDEILKTKCSLLLQAPKHNCSSKVSIAVLYLCRNKKRHRGTCYSSAWFLLEITLVQI